MSLPFLIHIVNVVILEIYFFPYLTVFPYFWFSGVRIFEDVSDSKVFNVALNLKMLCSLYFLYLQIPYATKTCLRMSFVQVIKFFF